MPGQNSTQYLHGPHMLTCMSDDIRAASKGWCPVVLLPDLDLGITELLEGLRWNLTGSDGLTHDVPEVVYWIWVGLPLQFL